MNAQSSPLTSNRPQCAAISVRERLIRETERFLNDHLHDEVIPWPRRHQHRDRTQAAVPPLRQGSGE